MKDTKDISAIHSTEVDRREFLKKSSMLLGGAALMAMVPPGVSLAWATHETAVTLTDTDPFFHPPSDSIVSSVPLSAFRLSDEAVAAGRAFAQAFSDATLGEPLVLSLLGLDDC